MGNQRTEKFHLNEEVQVVMYQRRRATHRRVMNKRTLTMGFHHGFLQVFPPTWKLQRMTRKQLIDNWYVGNKIENIPPLELLSALHVSHLVDPVNRISGKANLIQMRRVMETLKKYANKDN